MHLHARMADTMVRDVILSILDESLYGQDLDLKKIHARVANATLHISMKSWLTINKSSVSSEPVVVINFALPLISQGPLDSWTNIHSESEQWCFHFPILQQD